ncbi:uncharacterized protein A1O9_01243 [Exophiala aquamarina CBS 119918]|uniref:Clr5 domain-containing protein n=1 Tax=Exophiala aquamarina CBS 119918 TaxID=1182545 RepID=A0A072PTW2_9EURO|nr:uncharacterized protein A1O9_01243 [Exophiala aquamarina CBS 119918]KEF63266.1 hypothetical protein A1O9_01243 [Exophiala aquamarina CBS 119918]
MTSSHTENAAPAVFRGVNDAPRGSAQHPAAVWEAHKAEIRRLYMNERKPLREIISIMAGKGFCATPHMYKRKIKQWELVKNNNTRTRLPQRPKHSRASTDDEDACDDKEGSRSRETGSTPAGETSGAPHGLILASPQYAYDHHPMTIISLPDPIKFRQGLIGGFRQLLLRHYSLEPILNSGIAPYLGHIVSESRQSINGIIQSSWFFAGKQNEDGRKFAERGFNTLLDLFRDQDFYSLIYLFISLPRLKDSGLMQLLWNCLAYNASDSRILGRSHSLSILLQLIRDFYHIRGAAELTFAVHDAMKAIFQIVESMDNVDDFAMTWLKCDYAWSMAGFDSLWVQKVEKEIMFLRDSLCGEVGQREVQIWSAAMSLHLKYVQRVEDNSSPLDELRPEDFVNSLHSLDGKPYDKDTLQLMCFQTMSQYQRALWASRQLGGSSTSARMESFSLIDTAIDKMNSLVGRSIKIDDIRRLESHRGQADRWEEVESAKIKWVMGLWMLQE